MDSYDNQWPREYPIEEPEDESGSWWPWFLGILFFIFITSFMYNEMMYDEMMEDMMYDQMYEDMMEDDIYHDDLYNEMMYEDSYYNSFECSYNAYNCDDFATQEKAQSTFEFCGGVSNDVHHLDRDMDGLACEILP